MPFDSQWSGDIIAASFRPTYDREDAFFEDLGGTSWRVDSRADPPAFLKERRDTGIELAPDCSAPSSERRPQCVAVNWSISRNEPVRCLSKTNPWGPRVVAVTSWVIDLVIEGLALSAATLHPEFLLPLDEHAHRRDLGKYRPDGGRTDIAQTDFAVWHARSTSIASIVAELWSKMRREREIRRISAAWETIDDRTLKDIGISRYEIEYGRDARHWS